MRACLRGWGCLGQQAATKQLAAREAELASRQAGIDAVKSELQQQREQAVAKQHELQELQTRLAADAAALSDQLAAFDRNRDQAVAELQVRRGLSPVLLCTHGRSLRCPHAHAADAARVTCCGVVARVAPATGA